MSKITERQEQQNKKVFREKRMNKGETTVLKTQSTKEYQLIRIKTSYYINRTKDNKTISLGDKEQSENFILDGLHTMREDVKQLFKN